MFIYYIYFRMPKKYTFTKQGKTQNYDKETLEKAYNAVKNGSMSVSKASKEFGIPKSTLGDRISGNMSYT